VHRAWPKSHCSDIESMTQAALLLYGPSQAGKSTFMKTLMTTGHGEPPAVGDGSGESVTKDITFFTSKVGPMGDGPGNNDSMLRFSNEEIGKMWALEVAGKNLKRIKVLVFESMATDSVQLRATLASLVTTFGHAILPGTLVLVSKNDTRSEAAANTRIAKIHEIMDEHGLSELVRWQSHVLDGQIQETQLQEQLEALQSALKRIQGVPTSDLENLWQRQMLRAQELFELQPVRTHQVEVEEEYQVPYQTTEIRTVMSEQSRRVIDGPKGPFLTNITFSQDPAGASEEDIRRGSKGAFIYPRFEWTLNQAEAVRGFQLVLGAGAPAGYERIEFDLNKGARGSFNYLCMTRQGSEPPVSAVTFLKFDGPFHGTVHGEWKVYPQDLLVNGKGKYVYVGYKQAAIKETIVTETVENKVEVEVTGYRPATRKVSKDVEYRLTLEDFHQQALDQVIREVRESFALHENARM